MLWINCLSTSPGGFRRHGARLLLGTVLPAAAFIAAATPTTALPAVYVDLIDHPRQEANWGRFHWLEDQLAAAFFDACSDGGCGARGRLWPLQLRCSVRVADGTVAACLWVVAGSDLHVRGAGPIERNVVVWRCALPMAPALAVDAFHAALEVPDLLSVRLPGAASTLGQGLRACLSRPGTSS